MIGDASGKVYADVLLGGSGNDVTSYVDRTVGVTVDADGTSGDDGQAGEHDSLGADVETTIGGRGNDRLTGNNGPGHLLGYAGNDVLHGAGGDDLVEGRDALYGDADDDLLFGGEEKPAADTLDGGTNGATGYECHPLQPGHRSQLRTLTAAPCLYGRCAGPWPSKIEHGHAAHIPRRSGRQHEPQHALVTSPHALDGGRRVTCGLSLWPACVPFERETHRHQATRPDSATDRCFHRLGATWRHLLH